MKIIYIGCGTDVEPQSQLEYEKFVAVDCQPFSEFGILECDTVPGGFSRPKYPSLLYQAMDTVSGVPIKITRDKHIYYCNGKLVTHLLNTSCPDHIERIIRYGPYDTILCRGHWPHADVLMSCVAGPLTFIGYAGTVWVVDDNDSEDEKESLIALLHDCETVRRRFARFIYIDGSGNRRETETWSKFVEIADS